MLDTSISLYGDGRSDGTDVSAGLGERALSVFGAGTAKNIHKIKV